MSSAILPSAWGRSIRILQSFFAMSAGLAAAAGATPATAAQDGPGVRDLVEFTRIIQPEHHDPNALQDQVSPDGRHAFIVTRRADVASDTNWFEIQLLDLDAQRLERGRPREARRLLAVAAREDQDYAFPAIREVRWAGSSRLVFLASIADAPVQVYAIDLASGVPRRLTRASNPIASFDVSADLRRIVYVAQLPNPVAPPGARSVVVDNNSFWSVKFGQGDLGTQYRRYQYFLADLGSGRPDKPLGSSFHQGGHGPRVSISPDGVWAVVPRYEPERQLPWARQYPFVADAAARIGPAATVDPLSYFSRPSAYVPRRMVAFRLPQGTEQVVVDAPDDAMPGSEQVRQDRLWFQGGRSVVIGGTHLPAQQDGKVPEGSHLVEYWPGTGRWVVIARLKERLKLLQAGPGPGDRFTAMDGSRRRSFERTAQLGWVERSEEAEEAAAATALGAGLPAGATAAGWRIVVRESLDEPPQIVASKAGREVPLTRLNPGFDRARWGKVRPFAWEDALGRMWNGGLMVPAGYDPGRRYPLVIQTYGFSPSRFYLDGANVADGFTSGFAGRAFLREGLLVLALPWSHAGPRARDEREGLGNFREGVRSAIDALDRGGVIQRDRVGILGWSATGARVLDLVTFTDVPIRAATMLDGDAHTLFSIAVTYGATDNILARKQVANEGRPFADTRERWVRNDPSLHTDCIRAAMRIETYGPWVLNNWDIHALLRLQYKPAEMVVIPKGNHALSRPSERMISLQGNVDWYRFWLRDEERTVLTLPGERFQDLQVQYRRWRQMAELKTRDDSRPRCDRVRTGN